MAKAEAIILASRMDPSKFILVEGAVSEEALCRAAEKFLATFASWLRVHDIINSEGDVLKPFQLRVFECEVHPELHKNGSVAFHLRVIEGKEADFESLLYEDEPETS